MVLAALFLFLSAISCCCHARLMQEVLVEGAELEGGVCLDGSFPGYFIGKGSGSGVNKWILHQEGGGWCHSIENCLNRSKTALGSSKYWNSTIELGGIFSDQETVNGQFYNWNVIYLGYCDGGSFAGYREFPIEVGGSKLYFRGKAILKALIEHLMQNGMSTATDVMLTGCSAGGLATYLHADYIATLLPDTVVSYKAMADAGYFLDIPNVNGVMQYELYMQLVHSLHNMSGGCDSDCVQYYSEEDQWRCVFAPFTFQFIKTPFFILNSLYDTAQLSGILGLKCLPPKCDEEQMKFFDRFREQFLSQLAPALNSSTTGIFGDSCLIHCQTLTDMSWATYSVGEQTMRQTIEDWYYQTSPAKSQEIDCPYPCNPTCPNPSPQITTLF